MQLLRLPSIRDVLGKGTYGYPTKSKCGEERKTIIITHNSTTRMFCVEISSGVSYLVFYQWWRTRSRDNVHKPIDTTFQGKKTNKKKTDPNWNETWVRSLLTGQVATRLYPTATDNNNIKDYKNTFLLAFQALHGEGRFSVAETLLGLEGRSPFLLNASSPLRGGCSLLAAAACFPIGGCFLPAAFHLARSHSQRCCRWNRAQDKGSDPCVQSSQSLSKPSTLWLAEGFKPKCDARENWSWDDFALDYQN